MRTPEELVTNAETMRHILTVRTLLQACMCELGKRAFQHDLSKLESPEVEAFTKYTPQLAGLAYGSEEYKECLRQMKPAIEHHQKHNSHHPEHYKDGVLGMDLFDLLEMLCDWKAAGLRHKDSTLQKSLEINIERFNIPEPLSKILANTIKSIEEASDLSKADVSYPHVG